MRNTWAVCKREFASYFLTPVGYVVSGMVAAIAGLGFTVSFLSYATMSQSPSTYGFNTVPDFEETLLSPFLVFCGMLIMFLSPLLTNSILSLWIFAKMNSSFLRRSLVFIHTLLDHLVQVFLKRIGQKVVIQFFIFFQVHSGCFTLPLHQQCRPQIEQRTGKIGILLKGCLPIIDSSIQVIIDHGNFSHFIIGIGISGIYGNGFFVHV